MSSVRPLMPVEAHLAEIGQHQVRFSARRVCGRRRRRGGCAKADAATSDSISTATDDPQSTDPDTNGSSRTSLSSKLRSGDQAARRTRPRIRSTRTPSDIHPKPAMVQQIHTLKSPTRSTPAPGAHPARERHAPRQKQPDALLDRDVRIRGLVARTNQDVAEIEMVGRHIDGHHRFRPLAAIDRELSRQETEHEVPAPRPPPGRLA